MRQIIYQVIITYSTQKSGCESRQLFWLNENSTFYGNQDKSIATRHSGFFFPMRIGKKKTGIHESRQGALVTLWIPVFFGQDTTSMEVLYAGTVLYL